MERTFIIFLLIFVAVCDCHDLKPPLVTSGATEEYYTLKENGTNRGIEKHYHCPSQLENKQPFSKETEVNIVNIHNCDLSKTPLAKVFNKLNINITSLDTLHLNNSYLEEIPDNYTSGLKIRKLILTNTTLPETFLKYITSELSSMSIENTDIPQIIPSNINLTVLNLKNSLIRGWENCINIEELSIKSMTEQQIPKEWPGKCTALKHLKLESLNRETVRYVVNSFNNEMAFVSVTINDCQLFELPLKLLQNTERLIDLKLTGNRLDDNALKQLPMMKNLHTLDLSKNNLTGEFLMNLTEKVPELRILKLDDNNFVHTFGNFEIKSALTKLLRLEELSLNRMILDPECLMHSTFNSLEKLNMVSNDSALVKVFKLYGLPKTNTPKKVLKVDLRGRPFRTVAVDRDFNELFDELLTSELWLTTKGYKLTVLLDSVDCDCNNDVLLRALKEFSGFLSMPGLQCNQNYGLLLDQPESVVNCKKATIDGCRRKMSRHYNYTTRVDCSNVKGKFRWPRPLRLYSLNVSSNHISSIHKAYLPLSLLSLDLNRNSISHLDSNDTAKLFTPPERRIWLAHNPIVCECENRHMITTLQENHSQIMDYDLLRCEGSNQYVRLISVEELCQDYSVELTWAAVTILAVLAVIIVLLVRNYWNSLKLFLYTHGCCLSCFSEKDLDKDRPYDAFLSFAHGDDEFVMGTLLPRLEGEPNFYHICVHYRDWMVGEWIPAQIIHSVRTSKRTIIILSKNFIESWWGILEFRHAHANAMSEGRARLLILILDDVLSEDLSPELRGYLELNTYLRCDDPRFWEKLEYAMPHFKGQKRQRPSFFEVRTPDFNKFLPHVTDINNHTPTDVKSQTSSNDTSPSINNSNDNNVLQAYSMSAITNDETPAESDELRVEIDWMSRSSFDEDTEQSMPSLVTIEYEEEPNSQNNKTSEKKDRNP